VCFVILKDDEDVRRKVEKEIKKSYGTYFGK
jgi:hypothetical protein